jgi:AraC-like DNA-binding protein
MKITKTRLKQIIKEELEAVMSEEEEEETTTEAYAGADMRSGQHRDRPSFQRARPGGRPTPTLDAASDALGMSPSELMMQLAQEMGVEMGGEDDAPLPVPEGG